MPGTSLKAIMCSLGSQDACEVGTTVIVTRQQRDRAGPGCQQLRPREFKSCSPSRLPLLLSPAALGVTFLLPSQRPCHPSWRGGTGGLGLRGLRALTPSCTAGEMHCQDLGRLALLHLLGCFPQGQEQRGEGLGQHLGSCLCAQAQPLLACGGGRPLVSISEKQPPSKPTTT